MKFVKSNLEPIKIELNGEQYPIKLTFGALSQIEESTGLSFIALFDVMTSQKQTSKIIAEMLYSMLIAGGVEVEKRDIAELEFTNEQHKSINKGIAAALLRHVKFTSDIEADTNEEENQDDKKK